MSETENINPYTFEQYFSRHELLSVCIAENCEAYRLKHPEYEWMEGCKIICACGQIVIAGDLCPNDNIGVISRPGHDLKWFSGRLSEFGLASKFLRPGWTPVIAVSQLREWAVDDELNHTAERRAKLVELAQVVDCGEMDHTELVNELYRMGLCEISDIGIGYDLRDISLLVEIQRRFAELYPAVHAKGGAA